MDVSIIVSVLVSLFGGAISSALFVGSMKADLYNMRESMRDLAKKLDSHIEFHMNSKGK